MNLKHLLLCIHFFVAYTYIIYSFCVSICVIYKTTLHHSTKVLTMCYAAVLATDLVNKITTQTHLSTRVGKCLSDMVTHLVKFAM